MAASPPSCTCICPAWRVGNAPRRWLRRGELLWRCLRYRPVHPRPPAVAGPPLLRRRPPPLAPLPTPARCATGGGGPSARASALARHRIARQSASAAAKVSGPAVRLVATNCNATREQAAPKYFRVVEEHDPPARLGVARVNERLDNLALLRWVCRLTPAAERCRLHEPLQLADRRAHPLAARRVAPRHLVRALGGCPSSDLPGTH